MSTLLGSTTKPTWGQEWFGSGAANQHAYPLTLPAGGPYTIETVGIWAAGKSASPTGYCCVWNASGTLLAQSASFTMSNLALGLGNSVNYEKAMTSPPSVAGGTTVWVGFARTDTLAAQFGVNSGGATHRDDTDAAEPTNMGGYTSHAAGSMGVYLYYSLTNSLPNAPTLNTPTNNSTVSSQTPTLNFTPSDPDGDVHTEYTYAIDDNIDMASPVEQTAVGGSFTNGVAVNRVVTSTLTRGGYYYWRVKTKDAVGYGPVSGIKAFTVASLPTASVTMPVASQPVELYYTAGTNTTPKMHVRWSYSDVDGHAQSSVTIKIYADSAGSPGSLLSTEVYTGSATDFGSTYAVTENTLYHVSVTPTCSLGLAGNESAKIKCRVRWARASYYFASGVTPLSLSTSASTTTPAKTAVVLEYTATSSTAEPSTWYANISSAGLPATAHFWHRATMFAWGSATPTSPTLNSVTFTYSANALNLDQWAVAAGTVVDAGAKVYGTQSLKATANNTTRRSYQVVTCEPDTVYRLQGRIWTVGVPAGRLQVRSSDDATLLADAVATSPTDATQTFDALPADNNGMWRRYATPAFNSGSATSLRVACVTSGASGTASFDALKLEASAVVTPWTPGFVHSAVTVDAGGLQVDATEGGIFRLKGSAGGVRDIVELGVNGLKFGGDSEIDSPAANTIRLPSTLLMRRGGTAFPSSPATNDLYYRTDFKMEFFYDGTRWLSVELFEAPLTPFATFPLTSTTANANKSIIPISSAGLADNWLVYHRAIFIVNSGGTALGASHKWVGDFHKYNSAVAATTLVTVNIDSGSSAVFRNIDTAIGAVQNAGTPYFALDTSWTKTGTPGSLDIQETWTYRVIAT